ncbi:50S ribosomal protein L17 [Patescibacteria group bacterium]
MSRKKLKKLGRNTNSRKALFRSLIGNLIMHEEIKTTESKAKAVKRLMDKLVSKAKVGSLHVRRQIMAFLPNKTAVNKLVDEIAPRFKDRIGGFTKLTRMGTRRGDNAMMVKMELIEKAKKPKASEKKEAKDKKPEEVKKKKLSLFGRKNKKK